MSDARSAFAAWLRGMVDPATPFTVEDTAALHAMVKAQLGAGPKVEVVSQGGQVFVRVDEREWVIDVA